MRTHPFRLRSCALARALAITGVVFTGFANTASAQSGPYARLLSPEEVQKVSGQAVHLIPQGSIPSAGGDLNFAGANGKMVLMVHVGTADMYSRAKTQTEMEMGGKRYPMKLFHAAVSGIGDEAFDSPPGPDQYVLYVRKGNRALSLTSFFNGKLGPEMKPVLSQAQLRDLAKLMVSRL